MRAREKKRARAHDLEDNELGVLGAFRRNHGEDDGRRGGEKAERGEGGSDQPPAGSRDDPGTGRLPLDLDRAREHEEKRHEVRDHADTRQSVVGPLDVGACLAKNDEERSTGGLHQ